MRFLGWASQSACYSDVVRNIPDTIVTVSPVIVGITTLDIFRCLSRVCTVFHMLNIEVPIDVDVDSTGTFSFDIGNWRPCYSKRAEASRKVTCSVHVLSSAARCWPAVGKASGPLAHPIDAPDPLAGPRTFAPEGHVEEVDQ